MLQKTLIFYLLIRKFAELRKNDDLDFSFITHFFKIKLAQSVLKHVNNEIYQTSTDSYCNYCKCYCIVSLLSNKVPEIRLS